MTLSALSAVLIDPRDQENAAILNNTTLSLSIAKIKLREKINLSVSLLGVLPTNDILVRNERFRGGVGTKGALRFSSIGNSRFDLSFASSIRKNFNDYEISATGNPLLESSFSQELKLDFRATDRFTTSLFGRYILAKTYAGSERQRFLADLSAAYQINKQWNLNAGITNTGDAFKADGVASNIRLFDAETTEVYFGVGLSL